MATTNKLSYITVFDSRETLVDLNVLLHILIQHAHTHAATFQTITYSHLHWNVSLTLR